MSTDIWINTHEYSHRYLWDKMWYPDLWVYQTMSKWYSRVWYPRVFPRVNPWWPVGYPESWHALVLATNFGQVMLETSIVLVSITMLVGKWDGTSVVLVSTSNTVGLATLLPLTDGSTPWLLSTQRVQPAPVVFVDHVDPCLARVQCRQVQVQCEPTRPVRYPCSTVTVPVFFINKFMCENNRSAQRQTDDWVYILYLWE
jgi:hypothetical protein